MSLEFLDKKPFIKGENGLYYGILNGFLYTVDPANSSVFLYSPALNKNAKAMLSAYLKMQGINRAKLNSDGITFVTAFNETLASRLKHLSLFLEAADIDAQAEECVTLLGTYYVYSPAVEEIPEEIAKEPEKEPEVQTFDEPYVAFEAEEEKAPRTKKLNLKDLLSNLSTQHILIGVYILLGIAFFALSLINLQFGAAIGYLFGWIPSEILVKRGYRGIKVYVLGLVATLSTLSFTTVFVLLRYFLSQTEIYNFSDYTLQSLTFSHCLFNVALALLLCLFGIYSTVPSKKKKAPKEPVDF